MLSFSYFPFLLQLFVLCPPPLLPAPYVVSGVLQLSEKQFQKVQKSTEREGENSKNTLLLTFDQ